MEEQKTAQDRNIILALDIGTRSIIGVVGWAEEERFRVLAIDSEAHGKRAMMDGQIEDIEQVARVVRTVVHRLEEKCGCPLKRVCVAAAGRALRMERASFQLTLSSVRQIDDELIGRLEAGAVSEAEALLAKDGEEERRFYLVGYTVTRYLLDRYPLATLKAHNGKELEAEVVATFLPSEVVESLYAAMRLAGLEVASLTLEPIAALNAAIPAELRLLNLVMADIGAGTSDIAVCRDGSVVGYTMATMAGDEITEALMKTYLLDFKTAERLKASLGEEGPLDFTDVLGMEQSVTIQELHRTVEDVSRRLAKEIGGRIIEVNGGAPSALFLAGGGSKLDGFRTLMAESLGIDERRVAVAGNNFHLTAFSDAYDLNDPEYTTPLGIAVSAALGLVNDSYVVTLNGESAKLFRSGALTVLDVLMMNGHTYADLIGRTGQSLALTVNGERVVLRGGSAAPSILRLNGVEVPPSTVVHAGDTIEFTAACHGTSAERTLGDYLGAAFDGGVLVNGREVPLDTPLRSGDVIQAVRRMLPPPAQEEHEWEPEDDAEDAEPQPVRSTPEPPPPKPEPVRPPVHLSLNDRPLTLYAKADGAPYYLMDLLDYSGIDFRRLDRSVLLAVNGKTGAFTQELHEGDDIVIRREDD